MISTKNNPLKFNRFARKVIGERYPAGKNALKHELQGTIDALLASGQNNPLRHLYPVKEGYGRTDALSRIANTVFGDHLISSNYQSGDAPVSYPFVWDIWKFDWVQYNGSVKQPLSRNLGEALGVGARILLTDTYGNPLPPEQRFTTSANIPNLLTIEHNLQNLRAPKWPEEIFGEIDQAKAAVGKDLFEKHCHGCHGPHLASSARQVANAPGKPTAALEWLIEVIPVEHIGTDPTAAVGFVERQYDLTATGLTTQEVKAALMPLRIRKIARDAEYRLTEVIRMRKAQAKELGQLELLLTDYPDPNSSVQATVPAHHFSLISQALNALPGELPTVSSLIPPEETYECDLNCQQTWLIWNIKFAEAYEDKQLSQMDMSKITEGVGLNILGILIKDKYFRERGMSYEQQMCYEGFGALDLPQQIAGYKPRPLEGVWATPPFLHNGSVPNLYQMLLPPEQRDRKFYVGNRDFDPKHVGYVTAVAEGSDHGFLLDTSIKGNHNTGHAFSADPSMWEKRHENPLPPGVIGPMFSDDQRWALVEYLKIHRNDAPEVSDYTPPNCAIQVSTQ